MSSAASITTPDPLGLMAIPASAVTTLLLKLLSANLTSPLESARQAGRVKRGVSSGARQAGRVKRGGVGPFNHEISRNHTSGGGGGGGDTSYAMPP